jgi:hypothetical protein
MASAAASQQAGRARYTHAVLVAALWAEVFLRLVNTDGTLPRRSREIL